MRIKWDLSAINIGIVKVFYIDLNIDTFYTVLKYEIEA